MSCTMAFHGCPLHCQYCLNPKALCPNGVWKRFTPEELYNHVKQDDLYFRATGGGVTFGGGEPLLSCKEILHFHKICRDKGHDWRITIETSLNVPKVLVEVLEGIVDHWIVDIKDMNPEIYRAYTGKDNAQVIINLRHLLRNKAKITVRVPLIPLFNTETDVENSISILKKMGVRDIDRFTYIIRNH